MNRNTIEVECTIVHETDNAIRIDYQGELIWIPLSQVDEIHRRKGDTDLVVMTRWIASKKGLP
jgi:hypothetical protein